MITNIQEYLQWLNLNHEVARDEGFTYAPKVSNNIPIPKIYSFDNSTRRASNHATAASLSELGKIELETFRKNDSPYVKRNMTPMETTITSSHHNTSNLSSYSSSSSSSSSSFLNNSYNTNKLIPYQSNPTFAKENSNTSYISLPNNFNNGYDSNSNNNSNNNVNNNSNNNTNNNEAAKRKLEVEMKSITLSLSKVNEDYITCLADVNTDTDGNNFQKLNHLKNQRDEMETKLTSLSRQIKHLNSSNNTPSINSNILSMYSNTLSGYSNPISSSTLSNIPSSSSSSFRSSPPNHEPVTFNGNPIHYGYQGVINSWDDLPNAILNRSNSSTSSVPTLPYSSYPHPPVVNDNEGNPNCYCRLSSVLRTSKQERSMNRLFYVCSKDQSDSTKCDFFQWMDNSNTTINSDRNSFDTSLINPFTSHGLISTPQQSLSSYPTNNPTTGVITSGNVKNVDEVLKRTFGHTGFRQGQRECIEAAISGKDVFCLMPTGGGKSIVYQVPALCCPGIAIVFSPLLSLIIDQIDLLSAVGVRAVALSSSNDDYENQQITNELFNICHKDELASNPIKLLYITPERFNKSERLRSLLKNLASKGLLSRFVIDEAHCLSQWGHDFRPDYLSLSKIRFEFPNIPIMCLTATANQAVVKDSMNIMKMRPDTFSHTQSFNRKNLTYEVKKKVGNGVDELAATVLSKKHLSGIIYCFSKKDCETVAESLRMKIPEMNNQIDYYHADLSTEERARKQSSWSKGDIKVLCATIAFGMGINKPDVRYVIHHTLPKSLTNYYQESGRAGRDGEHAECILLFSYKDKTAIGNMIVKSRGLDSSVSSRYAPGGGMTDSMRQGLENLRRCVSYCLNESECRRVLLLQYFGEKFSSTNCNGTCDNCRQDQSSLEIIDFSEHAIRILKLICDVSMKKLPQLTIAKIVKAYTSSKEKDVGKYEQSIRSLNLSQCQSPIPSREILERIIQHMVIDEYLNEESVMNSKGFSSDYIVLGPQASALEEGKVKLRITVRRKSVSTSATKARSLNSSRLKLNTSAEFDESIYDQNRILPTYEDDDNGNGNINSNNSNKNNDNNNGDEDDDTWLDSNPPLANKPKKGLESSSSSSSSTRPVAVTVKKSRINNNSGSNSSITTTATTSGRKSPHSKADSKNTIIIDDEDDNDDLNLSHIDGLNRLSAENNHSIKKVETYSSPKQSTISKSINKNMNTSSKVSKIRKESVMSPSINLKSTSKIHSNKKKYQTSSDDSSTHYSDNDNNNENDFESDDDLKMTKKSTTTSKSKNKSITNHSLHSSVSKRPAEVAVVIDDDDDDDNDNNNSNNNNNNDDDGMYVVSKEDDQYKKFLLDGPTRRAFLQWLSSYRRRWDKYWHYLNVQLMEQIVIHVPLSINELADIPGFGENRAKQFGDHIIATIYAFLESNNCLHKFPHAIRPTIEPCPTWMDPMSEEAERIRDRDKLNDSKKKNSSVPTQIESIVHDGIFSSPSRPRINDSTYESQYTNTNTFTDTFTDTNNSMNTNGNGNRGSYTNKNQKGNGNHLITDSYQPTSRSQTISSSSPPPPPPPPPSSSYQHVDPFSSSNVKPSPYQSQYQGNHMNISTTSNSRPFDSSVPVPIVRPQPINTSPSSSIIRPGTATIQLPNYQIHSKSQWNHHNTTSPASPSNAHDYGYIHHSRPGTDLFPSSKKSKVLTEYDPDMYVQ